MSLLQFILAPDATTSAATNDVWGRCAQARALATRSGAGRTRVHERLAADSRLARLRQLGWATVRTERTEEKTAA